MTSPIEHISKQDTLTLQELMGDLQHVKNHDDVKCAVEKLSTILSMDSFSLGLIEVDKNLNLIDFEQVTDFPNEWQSRYREQQYWSGQDVVHLERFAGIPCEVKEWDQIYAKYELNAVQLQCIDESRQVGLSDGLMYGYNSFRFREASLFSISGTGNSFEKNGRSKAIVQFITPYLHGAMVSAKVAKNDNLLTDLQREVLELISLGLRTEDIASEMEKSKRAIEDLIKRTKEKLDAHQKSDAIYKSIELGLCRLKA